MKKVSSGHFFIFSEKKYQQKIKKLGAQQFRFRQLKILEIRHNLKTSLCLKFIINMYVGLIKGIGGLITFFTTWFYFEEFYTSYKMLFTDF